MNAKIHERLILSLILIIILVLTTHVPGYFCQYEICRQPFQCGNIINVSYPFWRGDHVSCGHPGFELNCGSNVPLLTISSTIYRVLELNYMSQTLRIARQDLWNNLCLTFLYNTALDPNLFEYYSASNNGNITIYYGCNQYQPESTLFLPIDCSTNGTSSRAFVPIAAGLVPVMCNNSIFVPVVSEPPLARLSVNLLQSTFASGFWIQWLLNSRNCDNCVRSGGACGHNQDSASFVCYCKDRPYPFICKGGPGGGNSGLIKYVMLAVSLGITGIIILSIIVICYIRKRVKLNDQDNQNVENFILNNGSLATKRYTYSEVKKITRSFTDKLGQGGFGSVYKGALPDGQPVAVKVLTEKNSNREDFVNEVASISRTSHVNIVNLLGFCYDKKCRALVYEFMSNKSLDMFINQGGSVNSDSRLGLDKLYEIAVGVARGLEYLHRGCNTSIVHFDIKPQNILLDEDFCPKISDFGLAQLCKKKQSILSVLGTRGTAGYIAPEVFCRNFGSVSYKSDVYSYGMMVLEMAGARKIEETAENGSSESYFPDKVYEQVILCNTKKILDEMKSEEEHETARKMLLVGFWCIQTVPSDRPSMNKVVEMLEGSIQSIQIPPKPFLASPMSSEQQFSSLFFGTGSINEMLPNSTYSNIGLA